MAELVDTVWANGLWADTVWAEGVWASGAAQDVASTPIRAAMRSVMRNPMRAVMLPRLSAVED